MFPSTMCGRRFRGRSPSGPSLWLVLLFLLFASSSPAATPAAFNFFGKPAPAAAGDDGSTITNAVVLSYPLDDPGGVHWEAKNTNHVDDMDNGVYQISRGTNIAGWSGYCSLFPGQDAARLEATSHSPEMNTVTAFCFKVCFLATNTYQGIFVKSVNDLATRQYQCYLSPVDGLRFGVSDGTKSTNTSSALPQTNVWHTVVGWFGADNTVNLQIDNGATNTVAWTGGYTNAATLKIGCVNVAPQFGLNGYLRDLNFLNRVPTELEKTKYWTNGPTNLFASHVYYDTTERYFTNGCVFYDAMENANDSSTNAFNFSNQGTVTFAGAGVVNNCGAFSGTGQWLYHADSDLLTAGPDICIDGHFKMTDEGSYYGAVSKRAAGGNPIEALLLYNPDYDRFTFALGDSGGNYVEVKSYARTAAGVFYYVNCGYDSTNQCVFMSINNGEEVRVRSKYPIVNGTAEVQIGTLRADGFIPWKGSIDEVSWRVFKTSAAQRALRAAGDTWPISY